MVLTDSHRISRARCYLGTLTTQEHTFRLRDSHPLWSAIQNRSSIRFYNAIPTAVKIRKVPQPRTCNACRLSHTSGLASSAFARHYSRNHCCFLFLWVLRCFTSPRSLNPPYIFRRESLGHTRRPAGFPHSDIPGSKLAYQLPEAYRRLLRPSSAPDAKASTVCS